MIVAVTNAQHEAPVNLAAMTRLTRQATQQLKIRGRGLMAVAFIPDAQMKGLNYRFKGRNRLTDVLCFRYDGEPVVGEILIAPRQAQKYAAAHALPYREELSRYVVHGLLHWLGHEDRTKPQQQRMRRMEDGLLVACGIDVQNATRRSARSVRRSMNGAAHC